MNISPVSFGARVLLDKNIKIVPDGSKSRVVQFEMDPADSFKSEGFIECNNLGKFKVADEETLKKKFNDMSDDLAQGIWDIENRYNVKTNSAEDLKEMEETLFGNYVITAVDGVITDIETADADFS